MPRLPKNFDAYPVQIVLDSNGAGTVQFQPNGSHINVTRLYVQVATTVKQASVTLYKGSVSPANAIGTIVSGSTGGLATGQIYVQDGQILYVVWSGGDAGATATATFSGNQISFSEMGNDSITWSDPIAASDGSLVFPAIKSINYVPTVSGWKIDRNGSAEFSDVTVRGTIIAENGDIVIDNNGITVTSATHKWQINSALGFVSKRIPDDGTQGEIFDAGFFMRPQTPTPINGATIQTQGKIFAGNTGGPDEAPFVEIDSPNYNGSPTTAGIALIGQSDQSANDNSAALITAATTFTTGDLNVGESLIVDNRDQGFGLFGYGGGGTVTVPATNTETAVLVSAFSYTFMAGRLYRVVMKCAGSMSAAPNRLVSRLRKGAGIAGTVIDSTGHQYATTGTGNNNWEVVFAVGGSNVTTALTWTGAHGSLTFTGNYTNPVTMNIYDIGLASDTGIQAVLPILT